MRYAILSDIHSNLEAFQAVLADIEQRGGLDQIWCLGDLVGYGPDPGPCIALLRQFDHVCVAGNHDWAAVGKADVRYFNPDAAAACRWTGRQLSPEDQSYLANLPLRLVQGDFTLAHGSPRDPIWEYLFSIQEAAPNFREFSTPFCLVGHSHLVLAFQEDPKSRVVTPLHFGERMPLVLGDQRLMVNPGSVGQPRDGDPRASYAIYNSETCTIINYRVPYDIKATQRKMEQHRLPPGLIRRLDHGR